MVLKAWTYFKKNPYTLTIFAFYVVCWISLFTPYAFTIGEWPIAPVVALPLSILMLLNCVFRPGYRYFYFIISTITFLPLLVLIILNAW